MEVYMGLDEIKDMYDLNKDGNITNEEIDRVSKMREYQNDDLRSDAQRKMAWFALGGMLLYPFAVVIAVLAGLEQASNILGDMAATYFVAVAGIVAAFFGSQAFSSKK